MAMECPTSGNVASASIRRTPRTATPIETAMATRTSRSTCSRSCPDGAARPVKIDADVVRRLGFGALPQLERVELSEYQAREKEIEIVQVQKRCEIDEETLDHEYDARGEKEPREMVDEIRLVT